MKAMVTMSLQNLDIATEFICLLHNSNKLSTIVD